MFDSATGDCTGLGDRPELTVAIVTKDRIDDLRATLKQLRRHAGAIDELLVVDDGSKHDLTDFVHLVWPGAIVIRHHKNAGQSRRRSEAFQVCRGKYILQLDDDSAPTEPGAIERAIAFLEANPRCGALALQIFNGRQLPEDVPRARQKYVASFVGCGVVLRAEAARRTGGYRSFFGNEWEEEELSLQMLKDGWSIAFFPEILIHHRVSAQNRRTARTWMRGFRNKLWAMAIHYPLKRWAAEGAWTLTIACWDALRLGRPHYFVRGVVECVAGLPRALRLREPMSRETLRLYDALRFKGVYSEAELRNPPSVGFRDLAEHWCKWRNRPRQRSVWDRRPGDIGVTDTVRFAHEIEMSDFARRP